VAIALRHVPAAKRLARFRGLVHFTLHVCVDTQNGFLCHTALLEPLAINLDRIALLPLLQCAWRYLTGSAR
jgi:hypothetical protein